MGVSMHMPQVGAIYRAPTSVNPVGTRFIAPAFIAFIASTLIVPASVASTLTAPLFIASTLIVPAFITPDWGRP